MTGPPSPEAGQEKTSPTSSAASCSPSRGSGPSVVPARRSRGQHNATSSSAASGARNGAKAASPRFAAASAARARRKRGPSTTLPGPAPAIEKPRCGLSSAGGRRREAEGRKKRRRHEAILPDRHSPRTSHAVKPGGGPRIKSGVTKGRVPARLRAEPPRDHCPVTSIRSLARRSAGLRRLFA